VRQAGSYDDYIEELRAKYPCSAFNAGFPFVGGSDSALLERLAEACHGKPPSGYNSWEAYWISTRGTPGATPLGLGSRGGPFREERKVRTGGRQSEKWREGQ
jgi:hypothetical protein